MTDLEKGELRVVVPVGFLLAEPHEVTVSVERPGGSPLPVRLQLIPAQPTVATEASPDIAAPVSEPTPLRIKWPSRPKKTADPDGDDFPDYEIGGGD
jgi:hypothetical protein